MNMSDVASPVHPKSLHYAAHHTNFLALPRELRDMIYYYLIHPRRSAHLTRLRLQHIRTAYYPLSILLLSHQITEEFIAIAAKHIGTFSLDVEEVRASSGIMISPAFTQTPRPALSTKADYSYYPFDAMEVRGTTLGCGMVEFDPLWFKYVPRLRISATIFRGFVDSGNKHLLKYDQFRVVKLLVDRYEEGLLEHVKELDVEIVMNFVVEQEWVWRMVEPLKGLPMVKSICVRRLGPEVWWFKEGNGLGEIVSD